MVMREKARFYGVSEIWEDLVSGGARGFRAGVAHKLAHWIPSHRRGSAPTLHLISNRLGALKANG